MDTKFEKNKRYLVSNGKPSFSGELKIKEFKVLEVSNKAIKVQWALADIEWLLLSSFLETELSYPKYKIIETLNTSTKQNEKRI